MGIRFKKRIKIAKGIYLNVGKKGVSVSAGLKGLTINSNGRMTVSLPGSGLSYSTKLTQNNQTVSDRSCNRRQPQNYPYVPINVYNANISTFEGVVNELAPHYFHVAPIEIASINLLGVLLSFIFLIIIIFSGTIEQFLVLLLLIVVVYSVKLFKKFWTTKKYQRRERQYLQLCNQLMTHLQYVANKYQSEQIAIKIVTKNVWIGETKEQLLESLGEPIKVTERVKKNSIVESYYYNQINGRSFAFVIRIENDRVIEWITK